MSMLVVDFGMESSFKSSLKKAKSELNNRISDYQNIEKRVNQIPGGSNVSNCSYYVRKKYQQLESKVEKLNALNNQVTTFMDNALEADKRVASRIKSETKSFKKRTGIGKTSKSIWSSICETVGDFFTGVVDGAKEMWDGVKQWYEDNKYWIDVVVDAVLVIAAIAACLASGGVVAFFFAAITLINATSDLIFDIGAAYVYYAEGDEAMAERLSQMGGKDVFMYVGAKMDEAWGTDCWEGIMGAIHSGLTICAIAYSFYKTGAQILKDLKLDKLNIKSLFNGNKNKIKWGSHFNKENFIKVIRNQIGYNKVQQKDVMKLRWKKVLGLKIGEWFIKTPENARRILEFKEKFDLGKDIIKGIVEITINIKAGDFDKLNPFSGEIKAVKDYYDQCKLVPSGGVQ